MTRRRRSRVGAAVVAALAAFSVLAMVVAAPAPAAHAAASDTVATLSDSSITALGESGFRSHIALAPGDTGKWEFRLRYRNLATGATDQRSVTLSNPLGWTQATLSMTGLPLGGYDVWVEGRIWGVESSVFTVASTNQFLGFRAPTALAVSPLSSQTVRVAWTPATVVPSNGGYRIRWRLASSTGVDAWSSVDVAGSAAGQVAVDGLVDGSDYRFTVTTLSNGVEHETSAAVDGRAVTSPAPPTSAGIAATDGGATWTLGLPSTAAAPSGVDGVRFEIARSDDLLWTSAAPTRTGSAWTFGGLANGTAYSIRARATNAVGSSSSVTATVTPIALPAAPVLGAVERTIDSISVDAVFPTGPSAPAASRIWQLGTVTSTGVDWHDVTPTFAAGRYAVAAAAGNDHRLRAASVNQLGTGPWAESDLIVAVGAPLAPQIGPAGIGSGVADFDVVFPTVPGRPSDAADAVWQISEVSAPTVWTEVTVEHDQDGRVLVTDLTDGTDYRLRVAVANGFGRSEWAVSGVFRPIARPVAPSITRVTPADGSLIVSATLPSSALAPAAGSRWEVAEVHFSPATASGQGAEGGPVTAGKLRVGAALVTPPYGWVRSVGDWTTVTPVEVDGRFVIAGLSNATTYVVRVASENASGRTFSAISGSSTPVAVPLAPLVSSAVAGLSSALIVLDGSASVDRPVAAVAWQIAPVAGSSVGAWRSVGAQELPANGFRLGGLADGQSYLVRVRAANATGTSAWTQLPNAVTALAPAVAVSPSPEQDTSVPVSDETSITPVASGRPSSAATIVTVTGSSVLTGRNDSAATASQVGGDTGAPAAQQSAAATDTTQQNAPSAGGATTITATGTVMAEGPAAAAPESASAAPTSSVTGTAIPTEILAGGAGLLALLGLLGTAIRWYLKARKLLADAQGRTSPRADPSRDIAPQSYRIV